MDLSILGNCSNLQEVTLSLQSYQSPQFLEKLSNLTKLCLICDHEKLQSIGFCLKLTYLSICDYKLVSIKFLSQLKQLTTLIMKCNIEDFTVVENCTNIILLEIHSRKLNSFKYLKKLFRLNSLLLRNIPLGFNFIPESCKNFEMNQCQQQFYDLKFTPQPSVESLKIQDSCLLSLRGLPVQMITTLTLVNNKDLLDITSLQNAKKLKLFNILNQNLLLEQIVSVPLIDGLRIICDQVRIQIVNPSFVAESNLSYRCELKNCDILYQDINITIQQFQGTCSDLINKYVPEVKQQVASSCNVTGRIIQQYLFIKELGQGGNGKVFLVEKNGLQYAAKQFNSTAQKEVVKLKKFINCPTVVKYVDDFVYEQHTYLIMEYLQNGDLIRLVDKYRLSHIPESLILQILEQMIKALSDLFRLYTVHRDFKPQNILISSLNIKKLQIKVKLADFGIAKTDSNSTSRISGTVYYLAPEIVTDSQYSNQSDIYSMGATLVHLTCGKAPFSDKSCIYASVMKQITEFDGIFPIPSCYSKELIQLIGMMTVPDPKQRINIEQLQLIQFYQNRINLDKVLLDKQLQKVESKAVDKFEVQMEGLSSKLILHQQCDLIKLLDEHRPNTVVFTNDFKLPLLLGNQVACVTFDNFQLKGDVDLKYFAALRELHINKVGGSFVIKISQPQVDKIYFELSSCQIDLGNVSFKFILLNKVKWENIIVNAETLLVEDDNLEPVLKASGTVTYTQSKAFFSF